MEKTSNPPSPFQKSGPPEIAKNHPLLFGPKVQKRDFWSESPMVRNDWKKSNRVQVVTFPTPPVRIIAKMLILIQASFLFDHLIVQNMQNSFLKPQCSIKPGLVVTSSTCCLNNPQHTHLIQPTNQGSHFFPELPSWMCNIPSSMGNIHPAINFPQRFPRFRTCQSYVNVTRAITKKSNRIGPNPLFASRVKGHYRKFRNRCGFLYQIA